MAGAPSDLKSFDKGYIKFQDRGGSTPIGFLVPFDPSKKNARTNTVDNWASGSGQGDKDLEDMAFVLDNKPYTGFRILKLCRRYQTDNVVWRVEDPRGFQLEITSENLEYLLDHVDIKDGVMTGDLVWTTTHQGGTLWLLPEGSEEYQKAREYLSCRNERISLRDVQRGDMVLLHDGRTVRYLGGMYGPTVTSEYDKDADWRTPRNDRYIFHLNVSRTYAFEVLDAENQLRTSWGSSTGLDTKTSLKVGAILEKADTPLTKKEAEKEANRLLLEKEYWYGQSNLQFFRSKKFGEDDLSFIRKDGKVVGVVQNKEYELREKHEIKSYWVHIDLEDDDEA